MKEPIVNAEIFKLPSETEEEKKEREEKKKIFAEEHRRDNAKSDFADLETNRWKKWSAKRLFDKHRGIETPPFT